jgi:hypothetical protein
MKTLKDLHIKHFQQNVKITFNHPLINRDFVRNDPITCVQYYEHRRNCFYKLLKKIEMLFEKVQDYFFHHKILNSRFNTWSWANMGKRCFNLVFLWMKKLKKQFADKYLTNIHNA